MVREFFFWEGGKTEKGQEGKAAGGVASSLMADPIAVPTAPVWPPPPTSAPKTFTVEGVTVTRAFGQLRVDNPKNKRPFILFSISIVLMQVIMLGCIWLISSQMFLPMPSGARHHHAVMAPPTVSSVMLPVAEMDIGSAALNITVFWILYVLQYGTGGILFDRESRSAKSGLRFFGGTGQVEVIIVRRGSYLFHSLLHLNYRVVGVGKYPVSARRGQWLGSFREEGNAWRVAWEIGQCVNVPVKDLSARTKG